jgi:hypothetical protein
MQEQLFGDLNRYRSNYKQSEKLQQQIPEIKTAAAAATWQSEQLQHQLGIRTFAASANWQSGQLQQQLLYILDHCSSSYRYLAILTAARAAICNTVQFLAKADAKAASCKSATYLAI